MTDEIDIILTSVDSVNFSLINTDYISYGESLIDPIEFTLLGVDDVNFTLSV